MDKSKLLRIFCIPLMMIVILLVNILKIPNPMMILVIPVIYFTYSDGYINGVLSGVTAVIYAVYFFVVETQDPVSVVKMSTIILNIIIIILLIGKLKARDKENTRKLLRLNESLERAATTDLLTGALNREMFWRETHKLLENSVILQNPISVLFIDVDNFKHINDVYGHSCGDKVLTRISEVIARDLHGTDLLCRYGGDEFLVLLTNSDYNIAQAITNFISKDISQIRFETYPNLYVSVSIGISCNNSLTPLNVDELINEADKNMYQEKKRKKEREKSTIHN